MNKKNTKSNYFCVDLSKMFFFKLRILQVDVQLGVLVFSVTGQKEEFSYLFAVMLTKQKARTIEFCLNNLKISFY